MVKIHVRTPEVSFDVLAPRKTAVLRAIELVGETGGYVSVDEGRGAAE